MLYSTGRRLDIRIKGFWIKEKENIFKIEIEIFLYQALMQTKIDLLTYKPVDICIEKGERACASERWRDKVCVCVREWEREKEGEGY